MDDLVVLNEKTNRAYNVPKYMFCDIDISDHSFGLFGIILKIFNESDGSFDKDFFKSDKEHEKMFEKAEKTLFKLGLITIDGKVNDWKRFRRKTFADAFHNRKKKSNRRTSNKNDKKLSQNALNLLAALESMQGDEDVDISLMLGEEPGTQILAGRKNDSHDAKIIISDIKH